MTDLMIPIVIILVMLILIDYYDKWPPLLLTGFLFIPISWLFAYQVRDGLYTDLFGADITAYLTDLPGLATILSLTMFFIPMLIFLKLIYINMSSEESDDDENSYDY